MVANLVSRSIDKVRALVGLDEVPPEKVLDNIRKQLHDCAEGLGGEVSARNRAARLAETYLRLDDGGRHAFLRIIALEFGPERVEFGTDLYSYPVGRRISHILDQIRCSALDDESKAMILAGNARRLFGLG